MAAPSQAALMLCLYAHISFLLSLMSPLRFCSSATCMWSMRVHVCVTEAKAIRDISPFAVYLGHKRSSDVI